MTDETRVASLDTWPQGAKAWDMPEQTSHTQQRSHTRQHWDHHLHATSSSESIVAVEHLSHECIAESVTKLALKPTELGEESLAHGRAGDHAENADSKPLEMWQARAECEPELIPWHLADHRLGALASEDTLLGLV